MQKLNLMETKIAAPDDAEIGYIVVDSKYPDKLKNFVQNLLMSTRVWMIKCYFLDWHRIFC